MPLPQEAEQPYCIFKLLYCTYTQYEIAIGSLFPSNWLIEQLEEIKSFELTVSSKHSPILAERKSPSSYLGSYPDLRTPVVSPHTTYSYVTKL